MVFCLNQQSHNPCLTPDESESKTYNFEFRSYQAHADSLPGDYIISNACDQQCQLIHTNVVLVRQFIREQLQVNLNLIASINCVDNITLLFKNQERYEWKNAGWHLNLKQALFGQAWINGNLYSYGSDLRIVAHEFCHGLIQKLKGLQRQSNLKSQERKALEESLCDIFAILVENYNQNTNSWKSINNWQWGIGANLLANSNQFIRNLHYPLMNLTQQIVNEERIDYHDLSLIHSHAFYLFMNAKHKDEYLFDGSFALNLFGASLEKLVSDADFSKSRTVFENTARTILRNAPLQKIKVQAISDAFDIVGIT